MSRAIRSGHRGRDLVGLRAGRTPSASGALTGWRRPGCAQARRAHLGIGHLGQIAIRVEVLERELIEWYVEAGGGLLHDRNHSVKGKESPALERSIGVVLRKTVPLTSIKQSCCAS